MSAGEKAEIYLLIKNGLYYRPNRAGYTGIRDQAGRYTKAEGEFLAPAGVTLVHEDDALEFMPATWPELKADHVISLLQSVTAERDALKAENAKLRAAKDDLMQALRPIAMRGHHANPVQHVALSSCRRARDVYYRLYEHDCLVLQVMP